MIIAGGNSQTDNQPYFNTAIGRRSILVMTPAGSPMNSTYETAPLRIPPGTQFGGLFGDGGRNQLLCYPIPGNRVVLAGGQDTKGGDLYDTYVFKYSNRSVTRGPDMVHETPVWVPQHPEYPADYEAPVISSQAVCMNNSRLVFRDGTLVHGGGYDGVGDETSAGSVYAEQLTGSSGHHHHQHSLPSVPIDVGRTAAGLAAVSLADTDPAVPRQGSCLWSCPGCLNCEPIKVEYDHLPPSVVLGLIRDRTARIDA